MTTLAHASVAQTNTSKRRTTARNALISFNNLRSTILFPQLEGQPEASFPPGSILRVVAVAEALYCSRATAWPLGLRRGHGGEGIRFQPRSRRN